MKTKGKLFRIRFFGFNKNDVFTYINNFNKDANESIIAARQEGVDALEEVTLLKNNIQKLEDEKNLLVERINDLENQISSIKKSSQIQEKHINDHNTINKNKIVKTPSKTVTIDTKKLLSILPNIKIK